MILFKQETLSNGLHVIVEEDLTTSMVAINVTYRVGSKDEDENQTGFAHLFEHLMFSGSVNAEDYDTIIQDAGGESNAYTNPDLTNFYVTLPSVNIETALWLESDRMMSLCINNKNLRTQQKVVIEEFKETCLNEPFGDMWHHLSDLCYTHHPYRWPTIGKDISHIKKAKLADVHAFYQKYYQPSNATLIISGGIKSEDAFSLAQKWFADIPSTPIQRTDLPREADQEHSRTKVIRDTNLPSNAIYIGFHMCDRHNPRYYAYDLLTDVLSEGRSSRFYKRLLKEKQMFNEIDAFISGSIDPGILIIEAKPMPNIDIDTALKAIWDELDDICNQPISDKELTKLKNNVESSMAFSNLSILNKALSLAYFHCLGDATMINTEAEKYNEVTVSMIQQCAQSIFNRNKANVLIYQNNED
jgi:predicted Zn-dependent peptidase